MNKDNVRIPPTPHSQANWLSVNDNLLLSFVQAIPMSLQTLASLMKAGRTPPQLLLAVPTIPPTP